MLYPPSPYYAGDMAAKYYDRKDPKKAKEILKQASYNGEKLVLQTNSNYPYMRDSILVLSEQLKEAGVNADVQVIDWMSNSNNLQKGTGNWNVTTTSFCSPPLLGPRNGRARSTPSRTSTRIPQSMRRSTACSNPPTKRRRKRRGSRSKAASSTRPT